MRLAIMEKKNRRASVGEDVEIGTLAYCRWECKMSWLLWKTVLTFP